MRDNHWIITYTGKRFWPLDPRIEDICIEDIAHSLSNLCRFNGHCISFYSVAEHSVLVSENCKPENALWGLLHDAAEAYIGDMLRPLKRNPDFAEKFRAVEAELMACVKIKFGLSFEEPKEVREVDVNMLMTEKPQVTTLNNHVWTDIQGTGVVLPVTIKFWEPKVAESYFLMRFECLTKKQS